MSTTPSTDLAAHLARVQTSYNTIAGDYAERFATELAEKPLARAMLEAFAELVRAHPGDNSEVADIGCGPGEVSAYLTAAGLSVRGVDLSSAMVALARRRNPGLTITEGSMTDLDLPDSRLSGLVAFYSIIHIPQEDLPGVFREFHRVLAPGGVVLLAFQVGDEPLHFSQGFGKSVDLEFRRLQPNTVLDLLTAEGFEIIAQMLRQPDISEKAPQAYLLVRRAT